MSEQLKSYKMIDESYCCGPFSVEPADVYIKSDVDKLIAELNMRIYEGDEDFEIANNQINRLLKIVCHQKYKRCRAMMMWSASRAVTLSQYGNEKDSDWFWKWKDKWKKLAKNFNPNNSTAQ